MKKSRSWEALLPESGENEIDERGIRTIHQRISLKTISRKGWLP
jgi:hypothetical protein